MDRKIKTIPILEEQIVNLAFSFYIGEPCRICGNPIDEIDIHTTVYVGYSKDNQSRCAHKTCWEENQNQSSWKHQ